MAEEIKRITNIEMEKLFVLTYHKTEDPVNFERQVKFLKRKFNIIDTSFQSNSDKPNLLITMDDGDISNYTNAFPILKKHGVTAIFFVVTGLLNSEKPFWWDEVVHLLGKEKGHKKVWELKTWNNQDRELYLTNLRKTTEKTSFTYPQLRVEQLREMQNGGMVIANHSHTHPMFDKCSEDELFRELKLSTAALNEIGGNPEFFAYPNGNYSPLAEKYLQEFGVKYCFLFDHKINRDKINPLRISRLVVNDHTPMWKFKFILSGWHSRILPLIRMTRKVFKSFSRIQDRK